MEFSETGLPGDPILYQAFMELQAAHKNNGPEGERIKKIALRGAQILQETTDMKPESLVLPLLFCATPVDFINRVRRSYGENYFLLVDEACRHNMTANAYLDTANPDIKRATVAMTIAAFEQFSEDARKTREDLELQREEAIAKAEAEPDKNAPSYFEFDISMLPLPVRFYDHLAKVAFDPDDKDYRLKEFYSEKLLAFKVEFQEQVRFLSEMGLHLKINGKSPAEEAPPRPDFKDTGLADTAKVRAAYKAVANDPRIEDRAFDMALNVAKILSQYADVSPTAVGLALMDISYEELSPVDQMFLRERVDWDVIDPLMNFSVQSPMAEEELKLLPVEFRQVMAGFSIARMQLMTQQSQKFFDYVESLEEKKSPELEEIINTNLHNIQKARQTTSVVQRVIGQNLESKSLENDLQIETQKYSQHVTAILNRFKAPKGLLPAPKPRPKKDDFTI